MTCAQSFDSSGRVQTPCGTVAASYGASQYTRALQSGPRPALGCQQARSGARTAKVHSCFPWGTAWPSGDACRACWALQARRAGPQPPSESIERRPAPPRPRAGPLPALLKMETMNISRAGLVSALQRQAASDPPPRTERWMLEPWEAPFASEPAPCSTAAPALVPCPHR